jgi:hypothetical protein
MIVMMMILMTMVMMMMVGLCKHDNSPADSLEVEVFLDQLNDCQVSVDYLVVFISYWEQTYAQHY